MSIYSLPRSFWMFSPGISESSFENDLLMEAIDQMRLTDRLRDRLDRWDWKAEDVSELAASSQEMFLDTLCSQALEYKRTEILNGLPEEVLVRSRDHVLEFFQTLKQVVKVVVSEGEIEPDAPPPGFPLDDFLNPDLRERNRVHYFSHLGSSVPPPLSNWLKTKPKSWSGAEVDALASSSEEVLLSKLIEKAIEKGDLEVLQSLPRSSARSILTFVQDHLQASDELIRLIEEHMPLAFHEVSLDDHRVSASHHFGTRGSSGQTDWS